MEKHIFLFFLLLVFNISTRGAKLLIEIGYFEGSLEYSEAHIIRIFDDGRTYIEHGVGIKKERKNGIINVTKVDSCYLEKHELNKIIKSINIINKQRHTRQKIFVKDSWEYIIKTNSREFHGYVTLDDSTDSALSKEILGLLKFEIQLHPLGG